MSMFYSYQLEGVDCIIMFYSYQLEGVEIKYSEDATEKIQEQCAPGKPFSSFVAKVSNTMI